MPRNLRRNKTSMPAHIPEIPREVLILASSTHNALLLQRFLGVLKDFVHLCPTHTLFSPGVVEQR